MHNPGKSGQFTAFGVALLVAALLAAILAVNGCTSDPENLVGTPLVEATFDTVLVPLEIENITDYSAVKVTNDAIPVYRQDLLYLGKESGTESSLLANFDFAFSDTTVPRDKEAFPDSLFTADNIASVKFSLTKPIFYHARSVSDTAIGQPFDLYYVVRQLEAVFDSNSYADYPNVIPPILPKDLNPDFTIPNQSDEPSMIIFVEEFLQWFENGEAIGIIVQLDELSDPGLVGYGSRDTRAYSQFDALAVGTIVGPNFAVTFKEFVDDNEVYLMEPYSDTSTFDVVPEAPASVADGVMLRTGLRSYPALMFDYSALPANARINRALIQLHNDTSTSFGNFADLWVSELDSTEFEGPAREIELQQFREPDWVFPLSGKNGVVPALDEVVELEVTVGVQRYVNTVNDEPKGLFLTAGEIMIVDFEPLFRFGSGLTPDFYHRQFNFYGLSAAPELRPRLKITYSLIDELSEGGD